MLGSIASLVLVGFFFQLLFTRLRLPGIIGYIGAGIMLGPSGLQILDARLLSISPDIRQIALIVILLRAGLSLNLSELRENGRSALLLSFVPASFEILAVTLLAPLLLGITLLEAGMLGAILAAVSPAVIIPRMLLMIEGAYGTKKGIPQMIMAGASVDDIYVVVIFTSLVSIFHGEAISGTTFLQIPLSIILGIFLGFGVGYLFTQLIKRRSIQSTKLLFLILSLSFLFVVLEEGLKPYFPISGLLAVMAFGTTLLHFDDRTAKRVSSKLSQIWVIAELFLFTLVGAITDVSSLGQIGTRAFVLLFVALLFRMAGVFLSLSKTSLTSRERFFVAGAYTPKATVQAAIGAIPLAIGVPSGGIILAVSVLAIVLTAPIGAFFIDSTYRKWLSK